MKEAEKEATFEPAFEPAFEPVVSDEEAFEPVQDVAKTLNVSFRLASVSELTAVMIENYIKSMEVEYERVDG